MVIENNGKGKIKISKRAKLLLASATLSLSVTACGNQTNLEKTNLTRQIDYDKEYETKNIYFLYKGGKLYLSEYQNSLIYGNKFNLYDFYTYDFLGTFDCAADFKDDYSYGDSNKICVYQAIPISLITNSEWINGSSLAKIMDNLESFEEYIDNNYNYEVIDKNVCDDECYYNYLKIYSYSEELTDNQKQYHIGYNTSRVGNSNYIYDICTKETYRIPDIGTIDTVEVCEIFNEDSITTSEAKKLLDQYINNFSNKNNSKKLNY